MAFIYINLNVFPALAKGNENRVYELRIIRTNGVLAT